MLEQFKAHHRIVLLTPLHNFNINSYTKDYLDNILIARETFKYTSDGSVGLMSDDYKVLFMQASGSIYTNDDRYSKLDISRMYIDGVFTEIMGFDSFEIVRAQGTSVLPFEEILESINEEMSEKVERFYR